MKIGMILDTTFPPDPRVENEALKLIESGHEVHLFCFSFTKDFKLKENINGIHVYRFFCNNFTYKLSALAYTFPFYHNRMKIPLKKFIFESAVDIIHVHDLQIARAVFKIKCNKRIVLDLHENRPEIMKFYAHVNSLFGKFLIRPSRWKKFEFKYIKEADKVIVVTEAAKNYYCDQLEVEKNKFIVLPNTVRREFFTNYSVSQTIQNKYIGTFNILYVGDTGLRRGTMDLIKAIEIISHKISNVRLIIVGKSKEDHYLAQAVNDLSLKNNVELVGWQDFELFPSYFKSAHIGVSPLHKNIHHDTTYANKLFQYMAFALPVVVSDSTAQRNLVESTHSGLVHREKNISDLANQIMKLYNDKELYKSCSRNAKIAIEEKYNWDITSKELTSFYNDVSLSF